MNNRKKQGNANAWKKLPEKNPPANKFKEAQKKLQASVQKHIQGYESSSDEEIQESKTVIDKITATYTTKGGTNDKLQKTVSYLRDNLISGATTCLICISKVKRDDQIWCCESCHCFFHLMCIQRWSKDSISQKKQSLSAQFSSSGDQCLWCCPKCRRNYKLENSPMEYKCFCKKTTNPIYQALLVPHSCGEICAKELEPPCGHKCLLLCHPGPCPPCPVTVNAKCYCGAKPPRLQRCSDKYWSCGGSCGKLLECSKHYCDDPCHGGDCKPCTKKSIQKCNCRSQAKLRDCSSPEWQCEKVCGKFFSCGIHKCMEICHAGVCNACELSLPRTCPCGKTKYNLPCTEETPTCPDTCGKLLECGEHFCVLKCHKGRCGTCLEVVKKTCRCGQHTKDVHCSKPFYCETKCKNMRDCNKHPCNKKCCNGECPPCEKPCGKTLNCGNHKCVSVCHRGPCFPCNLMDVVTCNCGESKLSVPCGRKNQVKPPKCSLWCQALPECHHEKRELHKCHFGNCPPCKQICENSRPNCPHLCPAPCHDAVMVKVERAKASAPWEEVKPQKEKRCLPCPECIVPVPVQCFGAHEVSDWPCHLAKPGSCFRPCGRNLPCGNHKCTLPCHTVQDSTDDITAGSNCEVCENECCKKRPEGCQHTCPKPCHPGECPPCKQMVRIKCHCSLLQLYVVCKDLLNPDKQEEIQSCGYQCPKNLKCGHRCKMNCHPGLCSESIPCKKKVKVFCECKRLKKEINCDTVRNGDAKIECDAVCAELKEETDRKNRIMMEEKAKQEELKNKEELEKYMKKFKGKKKNKERRSNSIDDDDISLWKKYYVPLSALVLMIISLITFILITE